MPLPVVATATLQCSFGLTPSVLNVLPANRVLFEDKPAANIMDNKPMVNIMPFGLCTSLANPITAAQTSAALGVLTPGTCTPATTAPWTPGAPTTLIANQPALTDSSICMCAYGGVIKVIVGQAFREQIS